MRKRLYALLLALGLLGAPAQVAHAGTHGSACNQFRFIAPEWDAAHRYWTYRYEVFDGVGNFCWYYNQRVHGTYPPPGGPMIPPPAPPNNRPHGALVTLYAFDFRAIDAHRGTRPLPAMYTFDNTTLRPVAASDPIFNTRLSIGDVVVFDVQAVGYVTAGGPGSHVQYSWREDALADFLSGLLIPLPARSRY